ncbi:hypothetical protein SteCoe_18333 [Stentor coeruleus]|uniref:Autophagy-related protein 27 n=1 Tax=Stentor coeruleus TaxID=5963 RepID=A0A1R2BX66_9CILI|nr:hypothetical protein SteCoe_18333 [Stentor coeruleus]
MFYMLIVLVQSQTTWEDPTTGMSYNWKSLKRDPDNYYEVVDSNAFFIPSIYSFNFGEDLPTACAGQYPAAMESVELLDGWMESCSILGRSDMQKVQSVNNGIEITYKGGDICYDVSSINTRQISFQLICSKTEGQWEIIQSTFTNYCHIILKKKTKAGCPVQFTFTWVWGLIFTLGAFALYFIIGTLINISQGSGCIIPHVSFWEGVWEFITDKMTAILEKAKGVSSKQKEVAKNYEMV